MADLTPDQMVTVKAMAPFELADIFADWMRRSNDSARHKGMAYPDICTDAALSLVAGLGPCWPCGLESPETFGRRMAVGIITLLKEV